MLKCGCLKPIRTTLDRFIPWYSSLSCARHKLVEVTERGSTVYSSLKQLLKSRYFRVLFYTPANINAAQSSLFFAIHCRQALFTSNFTSYQCALAVFPVIKHPRALTRREPWTKAWTARCIHFYFIEPRIIFPNCCYSLFETRFTQVLLFGIFWGEYWQTGTSASKIHVYYRYSQRQAWTARIRGGIVTPRRKPKERQVYCWS